MTELACPDSWLPAQHKRHAARQALVGAVLYCNWAEYAIPGRETADDVLVLNVGGYVGESTGREIEYARRVGKPIEYLVEGATYAASTSQNAPSKD
jgi:hypothetical protein